MRSDPSSLSPALQELIERAYRSRADQARRIIDECRGRFPHYQTLSGDALERFEQNVDMVVRAFYRLQLLEGRNPTPEELDSQRRSARERFAQGVPLEELVGAYQVGLAMLWSDLLEQLDPRAGVQDELLQRVPITISAQTLATATATEAYVQERERRVRAQDLALAELLRAFAGDDLPLEALERRARSAGLDLEPPRFAVLLRPGAEDVSSTSPVDAVELLFGDRGLCDGLWIARVAQGVLAVLPANARRSALADVASKLRDRGWRPGVGGVASGAAGLRRTIREASRAVELGALLDRAGPLDEFSALAVVDLVDVGSPRAIEFARRVLGPLVDPQTNPVHLETLGALSRCAFSQKLAAAELGIHPHTLAYRMGQIRERYRIDLDQAETRLRIQLALLIAAR